MSILNTISLESNKKIKINFDGGDLSSDAGLLLINEFAEKIGLTKVIQQLFQTNDTALTRLHTDASNLMQMVYQTIAAYFEDDCSDELTNEPVMNAILQKDGLASQPTLSRFFNRMDDTTLEQFNRILRRMREIIYSIQKPEQIVFDIDTTLLPTYGHQEGEAFNFHYQDHGYHPMLCFEAISGDLLKAELREGSKYCSKDADQFMTPLLKEFRETYPSMLLYARADSGFAAPELYQAFEEYDCKYAIRLKENSRLKKLAADVDNKLTRATKHNQVDYAVEYGEFMYQADSWDKPRRVCVKIEKPHGQFIHKYTFVVTTMENLEPYQVIMFYCGRGKMENYIKEGKNGFDFSSVSSSTMVVNANRLQLHGLAYNLFNWFRRIALPTSMRKLRIDTVRLKLLKIAARAVHTGRYLVFKLCSSCPYKSEYYETLQNISQLQPQFE